VGVAEAVGVGVSTGVGVGVGSTLGAGLIYAVGVSLGAWLGSAPQAMEPVPATMIRLSNIEAPRRLVRDNIISCSPSVAPRTPRSKTGLTPMGQFRRDDDETNRPPTRTILLLRPALEEPESSPASARSSASPRPRIGRPRPKRPGSSLRLRVVALAPVRRTSPCVPWSARAAGSPGQMKAACARSVTGRPPRSPSPCRGRRSSEPRIPCRRHGGGRAARGCACAAGWTWASLPRVRLSR